MIEPEGKQALWHIDHYKGPWDGLAIDLGAYHGDFTLAVVEKGCEVIAYEAHPNNFDVLLENINGKASAVNAAVVGNPNGAWVLIGNGNTTRVRQGNSSHFVGTIALRDILEQHECINLLKIDIEGGEHEMFALQHRDDLKPLLKRVRFLQIEIHPPDGYGHESGEYGQAIDGLIAYFKECGFRDEPCSVRAMYAGDFCSNNHEFDGGRPE